MTSVESWRRDDVFKEQYINKFIAPGGWSGAVESNFPDLRDGLCQFMVSEDLTKARVRVNTCEKTCDFRKGDKVVLSGWLMRRQDDYIEIGAERHSILNKGVADFNVPHPIASRRVFVVCHGEHEETCRTHPYDVFEHCGDDNGVGGADPNVSGPKLCGNENFECLSSGRRKYQRKPLRLFLVQNSLQVAMNQVLQLTTWTASGELRNQDARPSQRN